MPNEDIIGELDEIISKHFEWKIPNYSSLAGTYYKSSSFTFASMSWHLSMVPGNLFQRFLNLRLINESIDPWPCHTTCSFSLRKCDGTFFRPRTVPSEIQGNRYVKLLNFFFLQDKKLELLPSDTLTIVCDINARVRTEDKSERQKFPPTELDEENLVEEPATDDLEYTTVTGIEVLSKNLKDFFANKDTCDTVLNVRDKEFKVHKIMLMARSSVFAAMFQHDTAEKQTGEVIIPDCDSDSFQDFLEFLYCGKLEDVSAIKALQLYRTSDKYDMQELKTFCIKCLMHNLTAQNICEVAVLADEYDDANLLSSAQDFFNKNLKKIFVTTEWENLLRKNFRLANKLLIEMSNAKE